MRVNRIGIGSEQLWNWRIIGRGYEKKEQQTDEKRKG